ncbi:MAG: hypothetical protein F6K00_08240 [Leptolyngbya sp. SIOISBB]|nr:hypothetical protein [Leptolyngbya sp. SIOISBB]
MSLANKSDVLVDKAFENEDQLERLYSLGCQFGQGYDFSKPLPAAAIEENFLQQQQPNCH